MDHSEERKTAAGEPVIGIIMLDTIFPRLPGDVGNPDTFSFPVRYEVVKKATPGRVVTSSEPQLLHSFVEAAGALERAGVKAIATSCGFLSLFHRELVKACRVPVFTSSLLQAHMAIPILKEKEKIGIITARKQSLTARHLEGVGIHSYPLAIVGMDASEEFTEVFINGKRSIDIKTCRREMIATAARLIALHPDTGPIILECTNMPPFARDIQLLTGRPVFDVVTMINYAYSAVEKQNFDASCP